MPNAHVASFHFSVLLHVAIASGFVVSGVCAAEPAGGRNYIGINVDELDDDDGSNAFADLAIHARPWRNAANLSDTVARDADGWPLGDASTIFFGKGNRSGAYRLQFEGSANTVEVVGLPGQVDSLRWDSTRNISSARITMFEPMGGMGGLSLRGTKRTKSALTGTGFKNLHLWRPGYPTDGSRIFTDEWEGLMARFDAIRFAGWGAASHNPTVHWTDRRKPSDANPGEKNIGENIGEVGMPIESMVALCNRTGTDAWINVPVLADSIYVVSLLKTVLYGSDGRNPYSFAQTNPVWSPLDSRLKLYLEFGDEFWNFENGHDATFWLNAQSTELGAGDQSQPIFYDGAADDWVTFSRWVGWRAAQVSLWARVAAGDARMMTRVRPVFEHNLVDQSNAAEALAFLEDWYGVARSGKTKSYRVKDLFWGGGGAIYSSSSGTVVAGWLDPANYPTSDLAKEIAKDAVMMGAYGLERVAYAGGPSLDSIPDSAMGAYNADPAMEGAMIRLQQLWTTFGGGLVDYCCATGDPKRIFARTWDDTLAPKLKAVKSLRAMQVVPSALGCVAPCSLHPDTLSASFSPWGFLNITLDGESAVFGIDSGRWLACPVTIPSDGDWYLGVRGQNTDVSGSVQILLADSLIGTRVFSVADSFVDLAPVKMKMKAGLNVVRLRGGGGQTAISRLDWANGLGIGVRPKTVSMARVLRLTWMRGRTTISVPMDTKSVQILSLDGSTMAVRDLRESSEEIDLRNLRPGVNLVRIESATNSRTERVFVP